MSDLDQHLEKNKDGGKKKLEKKKDESRFCVETFNEPSGSGKE